MIKIHCNQLTDFLRIYVLDWHVLCILLIPFLFAVFFPIYWFLICPALWKSDLNMYRPRAWLIGYWLTALIIWFVFLAKCLIQMRYGHQYAMKGVANSNCMANRSDSTEDLWCEDSYISHHESYNLPTPEYFVNVSPVQPDLEHSRNPPRKYIRKSSLAKSYAAKYHTIEERTPHDYDDQVPILQPPPAFDTSRSDSLSSDSKFDIIIASLQNLAHELEKDFDQDEEIVQPKQCTTKTRAQSE